MESKGFHSPCELLNEEPSGEDDRFGGDVPGSCGVNAPSSRSLSYTMMVPSACDTRNKFGESGTQRMAVHGELHIRPYAVGVSRTLQSCRSTQPACLLKRP